MPQSKIPSEEQLRTMTISELELKFRDRRNSFFGGFLSQLHGRRGAVLATSAFLLAGGVFLLLQTSRTPFRANYAGTRLSQSVWSQLEQVSTEQLNSMQVTLQTPIGEKTFTASELGVEFDEAVTKQTIETSEFKRKLMPWQLIDEVSYAPALSVNEITMKETLRQAGLLENEPINASLTVQGGEIVVEPGVLGQTVDIARLNTQLLQAALSLDSITLPLPLQESEPVITDAIAMKAKQNADEILAKGLSVSYGSSVYSLSREELASWLVFTADESAKTIEVSFNTDAVRQSVERYSASINRDKRDAVVYHTSSGQQIVSVAGLSGRIVQNGDAIIAAWSKGQNATADVREEAYATRDGGLLNRHIIVSLASKTASAYDSDTLVASFPISGGKPSTPTPTGTFRIFAKTRVQTMSGPGYSTPNIEWISWFYPDYALHGAYWHNDFGIANVSHGCVNFRNADALWIYNWAPIGTTVVVTES